MRIHEQTEAEEHDNLEQPCKSIHEGGCLTAVADVAVAHHHAGDVDGQIPVAVQQLGEGKTEEDKRKEEDGVERVVVDVQTVEGHHCGTPQNVAHQAAYSHLYHEHFRHFAGTESVGGKELQQHQREHVGHGVVASALQFKHGAQIVPQLHLL